MDDVRLLLIALVLAFIALSAQAAEFEYIAPTKQAELNRLFDHSRIDAQRDSSRLLDKNWNCEMYGMKTHLQVQRNMHLYKFTLLTSKDLDNKGAQFITSYHFESGRLVGSKGRFEDQVKFTPDGQLISRLITTSPDKTLVAFSVCKSI